MSPAFIFEGCGTREAVKKFRGHVFPRWFSVTVSLLSALFAAAGLFFFLGGRHKLALYYAGSALLLLVFNLAGKAFLVRRLSSVLDQILGGDRLYGLLLRKLLFHRPPEGPEAHSRLLQPDQPDRLPGRDHGRIYRRKSLYSLPGSGRRPGMGRSLAFFKRKESIYHHINHKKHAARISHGYGGSWKGPVQEQTDFDPRPA